MNIYIKNNYREILRDLVEERKSLDPENNFQRLAEAVRIPKSYLSKVVHGKAELSADQLHLACTYLQLTDEEGDYLQLLLELSRTGLAARRKRLEKLVAQRQKEHATAEEYLAAPIVEADQVQGRAEYFLDPWGAIVHMALLIPRFRTDLSLLASQLGISKARLNSTMTMLERLRFIDRQRKEVLVLLDQLHLPSSSSVYRAWRGALRSLGATKLDSIDEEETYTFSVVFTSDKKTERSIRLRILEVLKEAEAAVGKAQQDDVYQLEINLFPWTNS